MTKPRLILDCDPGIDDSISLMTALASPEDVEVLAITTVGGNVGINRTTSNACAIRSFSGRDDVSVYAGAAQPMARPTVEAGHVHGPNGLGPDTQIEPGRAAEPQQALDFLIETLRAAPDNSITLVPTGPLTNLAQLFEQAPDCRSAIERIVLMGGAYREGGNITASAEFNIYADPEAAQAVMECGRPIVMIGLDATYQFRMTAERMARLKAMPGQAGALAHTMLTHINAIYGELYGAEGAALHDPCTMGYILRPELFETISCRVDVETRSDLTRGHTAVDWHHRTDRPDNVEWVTRIDAEGLFELICERLERI